MKAVVNTSALSKELKRLAQVINSNTVIPILSSVKMSFEKGKLTIMASDLETTILSTIECDCPKPFTIIVEHSSISDICTKLAEPITIEKSDKMVLIQGDNSKFKLPKSGNDEEFPKIPEDEFLFSVDVGSDFFYSLYCANSCKNPNDAVVNSNTACLDFKKDSLTIVGTDAFVLYKNDIKVKGGHKIQSLVRPKFVLAVKDMQNGKLYVGEKFVKVEKDGVSIITRLQDNKYVGYEVVIPEKVTYNFTADRTDLISAITKAAVTSSRSTNMCALNFSENSVKITSQDIDYEKEGECDIRVIHAVTIDAIGVNSKQLLQILSFFDSEKVEMCISSANKSIYLKQSGNSSVFCLLQPLALN